MSKVKSAAKAIKEAVTGKTEQPAQGCAHIDRTLIGTDLGRNKYHCNDCGAEGLAEELGIEE